VRRVNGLGRIMGGEGLTRKVTVLLDKDFALIEGHPRGLVGRKDAGHPPPGVELKRMP